MKNGLSLLFFLLPSLLLAAQLEGVQMPNEMQLEGKKLQLNGMGLREATIFQVDVYVAGLYLESKSQDENQIINSSETKSIQMQFVRNVGAKKMRKSFIKSIKRNCKQDCDALFKTVKELGQRLPDIKKGDQMSYVFNPQKVRISFNGEEKGVIEGKENVKVVLSSFIGKRPPDQEMKDGMLGRLSL